MNATNPAAQAARPAQTPSPAQTVRDIIEGSRYLVLATADATGRPWSSPVYFAHIDCAEFFWVSSPDVTHSRNIAVRPEVGIVVFDSRAPISTGQGVYMSAVARLLKDSEDGEDGEDGGTAKTSRATRSPGGSRRSPAARSPTAAANGPERTSGPGPACACTRPPPTRTPSWPRTASPTAGPEIIGAWRHT